MNDLDFVTLVRNAVVFFILSIKIFAFVVANVDPKNWHRSDAGH